MDKAPAKKGIQEMLARVTPEQIEEERPFFVSSSDTFSRILESYEQILKKFTLPSPPQRSGYDFEAFIRNPLHSLLGEKKIDSILTSAEINAFLYATLPYQNLPRYYTVTGMVLSKLMQNSYAAGFNNFIIANHNIKLNWLGFDMEGAEENPLRISVVGNLRSTAEDAGYLDMVVNGSVEYIGCDSGYSQFTVLGNQEGEDIERFEVFHCSFKTPNFDLAERWKRCLRKNSPRGKGNRVIFIKSDGSEEQLRDYDD